MDVFQQKYMKWFIGLGFLFLFLSIIPFLLTALYSFPIMDDFGFGTYAHHTWLDTRSLFRTFLEAIEMTIGYYFSWQGSFTAIFLMALHPGIFHDNIYGLTTIIMLTALIAPTIIFIKAVFTVLLKIENNIYLLFSIIILFLSIHFMPSILEGIFWYNGAVYYTFFHGLSLLYYAYLIQVMFLPKKQTGTWVALFFLAFLLAGGNLVTGLIACGISLCASVVYVYIKKPCRMFIIKSFSVNFILIVGFIINCLAPGNAYRQLTYDSPGIINAMGESFTHAWEFTREWPIAIILAALFFSIIIFAFLIKNIEFNFPLPPLFIIGGFCILAAQFFPANFSGTPLPGRMLNIIYFYFIIWFFSSALYVTGWVVKSKFDIIKKACFVLCAVGCFIFMIPGGLFFLRESHARICITELRQGIPQAFAEENIQRFRYLRETEEMVIVLQHYIATPYALFKGDVGPNPHYWRNQQMASFFRKHMIVTATGDYWKAYLSQTNALNIVTPDGRFETIPTFLLSERNYVCLTELNKIMGDDFYMSDDLLNQAAYFSFENNYFYRLRDIIELLGYDLIWRDERAWIVGNE